MVHAAEQLEPTRLTREKREKKRGGERERKRERGAVI